MIEKLNIKKFLLMSTGLDRAGLNWKPSYTQDFTNLTQVVVGNKNAAIDASPPSAYRGDLSRRLVAPKLSAKAEAREGEDGLAAA